GSWLAEDGWVECWSIPERRKIGSYTAAAPVGASRFSADGKTLVIGSWNGLVTWRTVAGGGVITERQLSKGGVATGGFCPDADTLPMEPPPEPAPPPSLIPQPIPEWVQKGAQVPTP